MSRLTGLMTGACCGYAAGVIWKHHNNKELAPQELQSRMAAIEKQQAYAAQVMAETPVNLAPDFTSAVESLVEEAGVVWEKLRGLQAGLTSSNENARSGAFEQTLARFASWTQLLQQAIDNHPPAAAPVLFAPLPRYPEKLALESAALRALESDLVKQTAERARLAATVDQQENAAQTLLYAEQELRRMLPNRGL
jgi:hypothetical protein